MTFSLYKSPTQGLDSLSLRSLYYHYLDAIYSLSHNGSFSKDEIAPLFEYFLQLGPPVFNFVSKFSPFTLPVKFSLLYNDAPVTINFSSTSTSQFVQVASALESKFVSNLKLYNIRIKILPTYQKLHILI